MFFSFQFLWCFFIRRYAAHLRIKNITYNISDHQLTYHYHDCRKVSSRYTDQELVLSECEHLQDLDITGTKDRGHLNIPVAIETQVFSLRNLRDVHQCH